MIKEQSRCSSKILSRNYLPLKFALAGIPAQTEKVACLFERGKAISLGIVKLFEKEWSTAGIYLLKINYRNTRTRCEICSKLTIKTQERRQWHGFGVFDVNFEHILQLVLVFLLINIEHVITDWVRTLLIHLMSTKWP